MAKIHKINTDPKEDPVPFETLFNEALEVNLFHLFSEQIETFNSSSRLAQESYWNSVFWGYLKEKFPNTIIVPELINNTQYNEFFTRSNFKECVNEKTFNECSKKQKERNELFEKWHPKPQPNNKEESTSFYRRPGERLGSYDDIDFPLNVETEKKSFMVDRNGDRLNQKAAGIVIAIMKLDGGSHPPMIKRKEIAAKFGYIKNNSGRALYEEVGKARYTTSRGRFEPKYFELAIDFMEHNRLEGLSRLKNEYHKKMNPENSH